MFRSLSGWSCWVCAVQYLSEFSCSRHESELTNVCRYRCLHTFGMRSHRRGWRLRRLVLPLPRFSLRHLRTYKERARPPQPRDSHVRVPRGRQAGYRLSELGALLRVQYQNQHHYHYYLLDWRIPHAPRLPTEPATFFTAELGGQDINVMAKKRIVRLHCIL